MTIITEDLIRKKAEHNECIISTLEEISLHQLDIERIENIDKWCRELKILYLQSNLIPRIENVGRMKKLQYLNLALNNVERIENLEGCEALQKLDLTINFVGELTSIESLKEHYALREIYLTGNPCVDFEGYRQYVIATLPQLQHLDGTQIEKSERIAAIQVLPEVRDGILEQQNRYLRKRQKEKREGEARLAGTSTNSSTKKSGTDWYTDTSTTQKDESTQETKEQTEDEKDKAFWDEKMAFTPESRLEVHKHMEEKKKREEKTYNSPDPPKRERRLVSDDGRRYNVNEAKIAFNLLDDANKDYLELDVAVYKYLDTSLCDVDVQTDHVLVTIKGKVLQLVLPEEVQPDKSTAKRSTTTGHLVIHMPKATQIIKAPLKKETITKSESEEKENKLKGRVTHERLEVDPTMQKTVRLDGIVKSKGDLTKAPLGIKPRKPAVERPNSDNFVDDPDVPPLM